MIIAIHSIKNIQLTLLLQIGAIAHVVHGFGGSGGESDG